MKNFVIILRLLLVCTNMNAQIVDSLFQEVSPNGGINRLAIKYYGIEFSNEQRKRIENVKIEFIYEVSEYGEPTLAEINGITDQDIIDSLEVKTSELEAFNPRIRNGIAESSLYFMQLTFPSYKFTERQFGLLQGSAYNEAQLEDFEYIEKSGQRFDIMIGGMANYFIGKPSKHLTIGGGMKADINFSGKNKVLFGLNMSFFENGLKMDYPINSSREQNSPVTGFVGLTVGKWFDRFSIQGDLDFTVHNITEKNGDNDPDWVQLNGWSPGVVFNYPILLGKEKPMYYYGAPSLLGHHINFHMGLRYLNYSLKEASGLMTEIGLSYRMTGSGIKEYKFKPEFLER